jgi:hypothetical protein
MEVNQTTIAKFAKFPGIISAYEYNHNFFMEDAHPEFLHNTLTTNLSLMVPKLIFWDKYLIEKEDLYNLVLKAYNVSGNKELITYLNSSYPQFDFNNFDNFYNLADNYNNHKEEIIYMINKDFKYVSLCRWVVYYNDIETYKQCIEKFTMPDLDEEFIRKDCDNFTKFYKNKQQMLLLSIYYNSPKILNQLKNIQVGIISAYEMFRMNYKQKFNLDFTYMFSYSMFNNHDFLDYLHHYANTANTLVNSLIMTSLEILMRGDNEQQQIFTNAIMYLLKTYSYYSPIDPVFNTCKFAFIDNNFILAKQFHINKIMDFSNIPIYSGSGENIFKFKNYNEIIETFNLPLRPQNYLHLYSKDQFNYLMTRNVPLPPKLNKIFNMEVTSTYRNDIDFVNIIIDTGLVSKIPEMKLFFMCRMKKDILECVIKRFHLGLKKLKNDIQTCFIENSPDMVKEIMKELSTIFPKPCVKKAFYKNYIKVKRYYQIDDSFTTLF